MNLFSGWTLDSLWGASWGRRHCSRAFVLSLYFKHCSWGSSISSLVRESLNWWCQLGRMAHGLQISLVMSCWELSAIWDQFTLKSVESESCMPSKSCMLEWWFGCQIFLVFTCETCWCLVFYGVIEMKAVSTCFCLRCHCSLKKNNCAESVVALESIELVQLPTRLWSSREKT